MPAGLVIFPQVWPGWYLDYQRNRMRLWVSNFKFLRLPFLPIGSSRPCLWYSSNDSPIQYVSVRVLNPNLLTLWQTTCMLSLSHASVPFHHKSHSETHRIRRFWWSNCFGQDGQVIVFVKVSRRAIWPVIIGAWLLNASLPVSSQWQFNSEFQRVPFENFVLTSQSFYCRRIWMRTRLTFPHSFRVFNMCSH